LRITRSLTFRTPPGLPIIAVPTKAGTGSKATRFTVITDETTDEEMPCAGTAFLPIAAVVGYELTLTKSRRLTTDTAIDSLTHANEAFVSRKADPWRAVRGMWPVLLVAGGSFGLAQFVSSNWLGYSLTDVLSSMTSLVATLLFLKVWRAPADPAFALDLPAQEPAAERRPALYGWMPWLVPSAVVMVWIHFG
jgi:L-lactate permease